MPKYKPSPGVIEIARPCKAFTDFIFEELELLRQWNPYKIIQIGHSFFFYKEDKSFLWKIRFKSDKKILVESHEPVVYLGKGVKILMGSGKIEIS